VITEIATTKGDYPYIGKVAFMMPTSKRGGGGGVGEFIEGLV